MIAYKTIKGASTAEIIEKKSRFIAHLRHVDSEEEAIAFIAEIKEEHAQAKHNVYAYIIDQNRTRYTDDGEPSQTAGMPTLEALRHAGIQNVACVTTRYFGGVLLGTGGLVRAYADAANAAIEAATIIEISVCVDIEIDVPYAQYEQVGRFIESQNAKLVDAQFSDTVHLRIRVKQGMEEDMRKGLTEITRGQSPLIESEPFAAAF